MIPCAVVFQGESWGHLRGRSQAEISTEYRNQFEVELSSEQTSTEMAQHYPEDRLGDEKRVRGLGVVFVSCC